MNENKAAANLLDLTADVIETRGWCQNDFRTEDGRLCVLSAFGVARTLTDVNVATHDRAYFRFWSHIRETHPDSGGPIGWNDEPGRTEFEVIDALRHTAKDLRNEANL